MTAATEVIEQTKRWINDVVVGCNFCPFAANVVKQQSVFYKVENSGDPALCLTALLNEAIRLDDEADIETIFLIFPHSFALFDDYLDLVADAEDMLIEKGYEGIYQLASFHPLYMFANAVEKDAANYTNRSIYPMLHLLRESSIDKALENYKDPENIPGDNIDFARKKGLVYMKMLRDACM
ncbi:DUF1415 domain-containing protein [Ferruginibacter sp. SUN106]|uniref:DUF1415 domain-containing protein n=1 Tax=Ferruginibacter sp. SUN106 TaxID=2978348 RepID=UPI003D364033